MDAYRVHHTYRVKERICTFFDRIYLSYGLTSLGLLALCFVDTHWALFLFLGLFPIGYGGSMVLRAALLRENFGRDSFGRLFGLILGAAAIGGLIGPTLAGLIFDTWKNYLFAWLGLSLSTAFAAVLMWTIASKKQSENLMQEHFVRRSLFRYSILE